MQFCSLQDLLNAIWLTTQVSVHGRKCVTAYGKRVSTVQHRTQATARVFDYFDRGMQIPLLVSIHTPSINLRIDKVIMLTHTYPQESLIPEED